MYVGHPVCTSKVGIFPDYRNNVKCDHIFMDCLGKLWVGKILHRKYDHNWIKKRENYDSLPKGFSFEFPISLNHLKKNSRQFDL